MAAVSSLTWAACPFTVVSVYYRKSVQEEYSTLAVSFILVSIAEEDIRRVHICVTNVYDSPVKTNN